MSLEKTQKNIFTQLVNSWTATDVAYNNDSFIKPENDPWIRITIINSTTSQPCLGRETGKTWERDEGNIFINVFTPINSGAAASLTGQIKSLLAQRSFNVDGDFRTLTFAGSERPAGIAEDPNYYQTNVIIGYRTDEILR